MRTDDPLWRTAVQVADGLAEQGYAFVEDHRLEALVRALESFLITTGIPVHAIEPVPTASSDS